MNILFISDIHANYEALRVMENHIKQADMTICLGDLVGYHCHVNEVIEFLIQHEVTCIQGNHDRYLIEGLAGQTKVLNEAVRFGIEYAQEKINSVHLQWLEKLPISLAIKVGGLSILCCHGSPWDTVNGYIYADSPHFERMKEFAYDVIALGHTHRQYIHEGNPIVFNPGSVGQSRDQEGIVCAKLLNTETKTFIDIYLDYDFKKEIEFAIACGAKPWIYKHFKTRFADVPNESML